VTGYISAVFQSLSDCSFLQKFESENGHVGQVVAKNNLHHCKEHIRHYNMSEKCDDTLSLSLSLSNFCIDF